MVDRLSVIEHEIAWCNTFECDGPAIEDPDEPGTCDECGQPLEMVKVVRADASQGAVDALQKIADMSHESAYRYLHDMKAIREVAVEAIRLASDEQGQPVEACPCTRLACARCDARAASRDSLVPKEDLDG